MLSHLLLVFFVYHFSFGLDLHFRFKDGFCQKGGKPGFNPEFFGECGNLTGGRLINRTTDNQKLTGSVFNSTYIYVTHFKGGELNNSALRGAVLLQSSFRDLQAQNLDIRGSQMKGVLFENVNLSNLVASGSRLTQLHFKNCNLQNADFWGSQLLEIDFSGSDLSGANLSTSFSLLSNYKGAKFNGKTRLPFSEDEAIQRGMIKIEELPTESN